MIKASELRLGSFFVEKYTKKIIKVIGISEKEIKFSHYFNNSWQAEPIPLTEEILLECGFKKQGVYYKILNFTLIFCRNKQAFKMPKYKGVWLKIKYLHQLQNVYFVLENKELEVNL